MPLKPEELEKNGLVQFPTVMGGVVPVVNLEGVKPRRAQARRRDARRHLPRQDQEVERPGDREAQPGVKLPKQAIAVVHRSDGSGTTFIFTNYLSKVSPDWKAKVGDGTAVQVAGRHRRQGQRRRRHIRAQTNGAIGYVEYAYAKQNKLTYGR